MIDDRVVITLPPDAQPNSEPDDAANQQTSAFLSVMRSRFETVRNAEDLLRRNMMQDWLFRGGDQWAPDVLAARNEDDRACLTINRLPQFIRQVTNAQRTANLAVKVQAVDSGADIKTAEVLQGIIRNIEQQSDAAVAYSTAGDHQVTIGRGYWRIDTEFETELSFVQRIVVKRIRNPFTVFMDPSAMEPDGSDARYVLIIEDVPTDEYKIRFPGARIATIEDFETMGINWAYNDWMPTGKVRIAEYWYVEEVNTLAHLVEAPVADPGVDPVSGQPLPGMTMQVAVLDEDLSKLPAGYKILRSRPTRTRRVRQSLCSAIEILEGNTDKTAGALWPGKWIPVVPCIGDEMDINGRLDLRGMVRDARDPQRLYNYQNSTLAETLAMVPRAPWIGAEGSFEGHEVKWREANRRAFPYLEYKPKSIGGQLTGPPVRTSAGADVGAIMTAIQQSDQDLKATMGLYEPSLGVRQGAAQSGKAIQALQQQGETANSNFLDNMGRSIRFTGRILVDLIPHIYDVTRVLRILGSDNQEKSVAIHANDPNAPESDALPAGVQGIYNVGTGRYDIVVSAAPSVETKRKEALAVLSEFVTAYPAAFPVLGDLLVGALDWPGAQAAAERLKRGLPEQFRDPEDGAAPPVPPEIAAKMQELMAQLEQMGVELQQAQQIIQTKQIESEAKLKIEREQSAVDLKIAELKAALEKLKIEADLSMHRADMAHDRAMEAQARTDDRSDASRDRSHSVEDQARGDAREDAIRIHEPKDEK